MSLAAVIFDMDGVLVESEPHWRAVSSEFLRGILPGWNEENQRQIHGRSIDDVFKVLVSSFGLELSRSEFLARYQGISRDIYTKHSTLIPGAKEFAIELKSAGVMLALASSSPRSWIELVVERFDLQELFPIVVSSDDVAGVIKPEPDIYLHAIRQLDCKVQQVVAIEDSPKGILSAQAAGLSVVALVGESNEKLKTSLQATLEVELQVSSFFDCSIAEFEKLLREKAVQES